MIKFNKHQLDNGLTLIHHFDDTTPFVLVNTLYKVGARNESKDKTGFAHLFEHLMFGGSKNAKDFDIPLQEAGGSNNAFTNNDYTNYYDIVPKENIDVALFLEADRMVNLNINEKTLSVQQSVVIEEFKENYLNQPYGDIWHILREMVYETHPYQWPTIGLKTEHIADAKLSDVTSFYNTHYAPNNAILTIAGNVSFEDTLKRVNHFFNSIEKKKEKETTIPKEGVQLKPNRKTVERDIPINALYMVFKMPGRLEKDYYTADLLSDILSMGKSARLHKRLVKQEQVALQTDAYISGSIDTGMFVVEARIKEGIAIENVEEIIWEEINTLIESGVSDEELNRIKNKMITYLNFSENDLMSRGVGLSYFEMLGDANLINLQEATYEHLTSKEVVAFAKTFLQKEKSNVLYYLKKTSQSYS